MQDLDSTPSSTIPRSSRIDTVRASWINEWPLFSILGSVVILAARVLRFPSGLRDAVTLEPASGFHLIYPQVHLLFSPWFDIADCLNVIGIRQAEAVAAAVLVLAVAWKGWWKGILIFLGFVLFTLAAIFLPRPMTRLVADNPDDMIVNFHSHSSFSHDGRSSFTPAANARWHQDQGFNVGFITDHLTVDGSMAGFAATNRGDGSQYRSLSGLQGVVATTQMLVLGADQSTLDGILADRRAGATAITGTVARLHEKGLLVIGCLQSGWMPRKAGTVSAALGRVKQAIDSGVDACEIIDEGPATADVVPEERSGIIELCRAAGRPVMSGSDNHGFGSAVGAWSTMHLPGWRSLDNAALQKRIFSAIRTEGFDSIHVFEQPRFVPASILQNFFSPAGMIWTRLRALPPAAQVSWLFWLWIIPIAGFVARRRIRAR